MPWEWIILPLAGAFIGWITNRLAIRLLFRPHLPLRLLGLEIQGLLPRRRTELAGSVGRVLEEKILTDGALLERMRHPEVLSAASRLVENATRETLKGRLRLLPGIITRPVTDRAARLAGEEARRYLIRKAPEMIRNLRSQVAVGDTVTKELDALPMDDLEHLVMELARRELRHIEYLGGVLGFLVGMAQAGILRLLP